MSETSSPAKQNSEEIPAATAVIFRHGAAEGPPEILMVVRSRKMSFAGGAAVFPGGRVDPADFDLAAKLGGDLPVDEIAHRIAAIRETLEETGLAIGLTGNIDADRAAAARTQLLECGTLEPVLEAMGWQIDLEQIIPFARWFPKNERLSRIFDTRFYLADLGTGAVDITVDATENTKLFWTTAQDALNAAKRDEITIIFPTRRNLERLALFDSFAAAKQQAEAIPVKTIMPRMDVRDGTRWLAIPADAGYPVDGEPLDDVLRG